MEKNWNSSWDGFKPGRWNRTSVNVRDFIQSNYTPYEGDDSFLAGPTEAKDSLGSGNGSFKAGTRSRRSS